MSQQIHFIFFTILILLFLIFPSTVTGDSVQKLQFDPFEQPDYLQIRKPVQILEAMEEEKPWLPELRAIIWSSEWPLVNINGTTIAVGEDVEGYFLQKVTQRSAFFVKDGESYIVSMDEVGKDEK